MATPTQITVMISSRCSDKLPSPGGKEVSLSSVRQSLKTEIEATKVLGQSIYRVWINEDAVEDGSEDSWNRCLKQASDCDIFIALFNGAAGWLGKTESGTIGICHAELQQAYNETPGKVYIVSCWDEKSKGSPSGDEDKLFQAYIKELGRLESRVKKEASSLAAKVKEVVVKATVSLVQRGVRDAGRGKHHLGPALEWSRLNFSERASAMRQSAEAGLGKDRISASSDRALVRRMIAGRPVLFVVSAIPDSLSVPAARELVGQPHLADHSVHEHLQKTDVGPVHLIACHKGVTESQAVRMLGFPNATVVAIPNGIYVVDPVQGVQLVLISQCRDISTTRNGVQGFLEWLAESNQAAELVRHAVKRKAVVTALADN